VGVNNGAGGRLLTGCQEGDADRVRAGRPGRPMWRRLCTGRRGKTYLALSSHGFVSPP
jgi:hypothetical protein